MATDASSDAGVLVVAHGERGGSRDNRLLMSLRDRIAAAGIVRATEAGVLNGEPGLDAAVARLRAAAVGRLLIYPFFMSGGYFVRTLVPARVFEAWPDAPASYLAPLGLDRGLPALVHRMGVAATAGAGWAIADSRLLIVGHGSAGSRASADATTALASTVARLGGFAEVGLALLEEPPYVADVLAASLRQTTVVGFFSGDGLHARDDVPTAIAAAGRRAVYAGPVGADPEVASLALAAVAAALG